MTHNGTGHVALYVALGIDWNAAYGINALKDVAHQDKRQRRPLCDGVFLSPRGDTMTTATFKTKSRKRYTTSRSIGV